MCVCAYKREREIECMVINECLEMDMVCEGLKLAFILYILNMSYV